MMFLIVCLIPLAVSYLTFKYDSDFFSKIFAPFFVGVLSLSLYAAILTVSENINEVQIENHVIPIVQMRESSNSTINGGGSFIAWSFNGSEESMYVIMEKYEDGTMKRRFLNQKTTYVSETSESPRVEYYQTQTKYPKWLYPWWVWDNIKTQYYFSGAVIYVPHDTVVFKFDKL